MKNILITGLTMLTLISGSTFAQSVPNKDFDPYKNPVTYVVPFAPGAAGDLQARIISGHFAKKGIELVITNAPGGGGVVMMNKVLDSAPNGYTLFMAEPGTLIMSPLLKKDLRYKVDTPFELISMLGTTPMMLSVNAEQVKARTVKDFVEEVKANPSKFTYGAAAETSFYIGKSFFAKLGVNVPGIRYPGAAPQMPDLINGRVPVAFGAASNLFFDQEKAGKLVILANLADSKIPEYPNVPMLNQSPEWSEFVHQWWITHAAPAGTPKYIVEFYNKLFNEALADPEVRAKIEKLGFVIKGGSSKFARDFYKAEVIKFSKEVKEVALVN